MDGYAILYATLKTALKEAGGECAMLLGQELSITLSESSLTSKSSYCGGLEDICFILGVHSTESYEGQFYLVFSVRDAIVMSSILLGIPPARIQEKKRLAIIENDDIDAFAEIGNMVNAALNAAFLTNLPNKVSFKLLPPRKYNSEIDESSPEQPFPDGDYLLFRSKLEMPDQEMEHLDVLIPTGLGNLFDPQGAVGEATGEEEAVDVDDVSPGHAANSIEGDDPEADSAAGSGGIESIVVLEDDTDLRQQIVGLLAFTGFQIAEGTLNADLKELFVGRNVKLAIIGSQNADDRELAVCIKVHAMRQDFPPPIIMSAECWTRTAVLKALKYGARDIIIKPFNEDEVVAKVRRYCKLEPVQ
ncbi:MAG TPA: response regulator [Desulfuromonadales bacterium]|nr:response regulator [Desulfuromonadales bacterium]